MVVATLALVGLFVSTYLTLWKFGYMGVLACGSGSCGIVQTSEYAYVFGIPVAAIGVGGYATILVVSLLGLQPAFVSHRGIAVALVVLSGLGLAFTGYLTYLEAFVIRAWCRWCLVSAGIIGAIFVASIVGVRWEGARTPAAGELSSAPDPLR